MVPTLSKSKIIAFRQCPKRLWLEVHRPELREDSAATQARFQVGYQVGDLAIKLYDPETQGVVIKIKEGFKEAITETFRDFELPAPVQIFQQPPPKSVGTKKLAVKLDEAAEMLSVSPQTVRRLVVNGSLKASRKTRHILIPVTELERLMKV